MNYNTALRTIDIPKALETLKIDYLCQGAYVRFKCDCGAEASFKAFGDKKGLWYCPSCKKGGNIISYTMDKKGVDYKDALQKLVKLSPTNKRLTQPLKLNYELAYSRELDEMGLDKEFCQDHGIGIPQGKTMLSGCLAFEVHNDDGILIAYYGIRLKTKVPVFHRSFNPELYVYDLSNQSAAIVVSNIIECAKMVQDGKPAICNFGLPYLSIEQIEILNNYAQLDLHMPLSIAPTVAEHMKTHYRFI